MFEQNIRVMVWGLREKEKVRKKNPQWNVQKIMNKPDRNLAKNTRSFWNTFTSLTLSADKNQWWCILQEGSNISSECLHTRTSFMINLQPILKDSSARAQTIVQKLSYFQSQTSVKCAIDTALKWWPNMPIFYFLFF